MVQCHAPSLRWFTLYIKVRPTYLFTYLQAAGADAGVVDDVTMRDMQMPRCGNKDATLSGGTVVRRRKRFTVTGTC